MQHVTSPEVARFYESSDAERSRLKRGIAQPGFAEVAARTLDDGQNRNPDGLSGAFTTAYFHHPADLRAEVAAADFEILEIEGLEGVACLLPDFDERWRDPEQQRTMLQIADTLGAEPTLLGASAHLLAIARKPG